MSEAPSGLLLTMGGTASSSNHKTTRHYTGDAARHDGDRTGREAPDFGESYQIGRDMERRVVSRVDKVKSLVPDWSDGADRAT